MGSSNNGNPMVAIDVEELSRSISESLGTIGKGPANEDQCTIYRVTNAVSKEYEQHYCCPKIIGIGLFHHDDHAFKQMEQLKWSFLQDLIDRNRQENFSIDNYILAVNNIKEEARRYYFEPPKLDDHALVTRMVLDGGFLLEFLIKTYCDELLNEVWGEPLDEVNWNLPPYWRDLLLLENQIPFCILQALLDASDIPGLVGSSESQLTLVNLAVACLTQKKLVALPEDEKASHLLHVYHASIRRSDTQLGCCRIRVKPKSPIGIPTATKLKESGVKFKKKKDAISIIDVRFDKEKGVMEIPMLLIHEATISLYRNLIAFEQCCPEMGYHFTSYATLMNSLIDTAADVEILKDRGIIQSKLGEDREVAEFFNSLCNGTFLSPEEHHLIQVFKDVVAYSKVVRHKWRAELMHKYCGSPWVIISLIAATILLCLTLLQTFYAVYAYHHPNPS